MSIPLITAKGEFPRDPRLFVRDHNKFMRTANRHTLEFHHDKHIPRHFEPFAAAKYGYAPRLSIFRQSQQRTITYQQLKNQLGLPPLVSPTDSGGSTRNQIVNFRRITATRKRGRLILRLPFKGGSGRFRKLDRPTIKQRRGQEEVIKRIAEIDAIAPDEQRKLLEIHKTEYLRQANAPGVVFRKKYRTG